MKKAKWIIIGLLAVFLLAAGGIRFFSRGDGGNYPYVPDRPAPAPHSGLFVSDWGTMEFNGDDTSIVIDFNAELAELSGLPEGRHEGTYAFLSGNLPPNGSFEIRYDAAHEMRITVGDTVSVIEMAVVSPDGKTGQSGIDTVTPERIPMMFSADGKFVGTVFVKTE